MDHCQGALFATLLPQHPSPSQQAALRVRHVMSAFYEIFSLENWKLRFGKKVVLPRKTRMFQ